jgi:hypothetical protein
MKPISEATLLEGRDGFVQYVGCNKLKDMKALITGGECVGPLNLANYAQTYAVY